MTKSVVAKFAEPDVRIKIDDLEWLAMMVSDPESLIRQQEFTRFASSIRSSRTPRPRKAPSSGLDRPQAENDHIMARKRGGLWGSRPKWSPLKAVMKPW